MVVSSFDLESSIIEPDKTLISRRPAMGIDDNLQRAWHALNPVIDKVLFLLVPYVDYNVS